MKRRFPPKRYEPRRRRLSGKLMSWLLWAGAALVIGLEMAAPFFAALTSPEHGGLIVLVLTMAGFGVRIWLSERNEDDDNE